MSRTENIIAWRNASTSKISLAGIENKAVWVRDDATDLARYVRMLEDLPTYETNAEDAVNHAEMALTEAGRQVLACEKDWIAMGGSDRWLGGVHLAGRAATWRWTRRGRFGEPRS